MNPFDWYGPAFLVFYLVSGILLIKFLYGFLRGYKGTPTQIGVLRKHLTNPYFYAALREGKLGVIELAVFTLLDRQFLVRQENSFLLKAVWPHPAELCALEKAILSAAANPVNLKTLQTNPQVVLETEPYLKAVCDFKLRLSPSTLALRFAALLGGYALLIGATWTKVELAFSRGHYNVEFLILLTVFFCIALVPAFFRRGTALGRQFQAEQQTLMKGLSWRKPEPGTGSDDALWIVAIFGASGLPKAFAESKHLLAYPAGLPNSTDGGSSGFSCGSSDSGGSSDGGSSGCGGGGCGGCGGGGCGG